MYENTKPHRKPTRRTDDMCKQHTNTESTSSLGVETGPLHQATQEKDTYDGKNEKGKSMSLIPRSRRQTKEITYAIGEHPIVCHNKVMQTDVYKTNRLPADKYQTDLPGNLASGLQKAQETLSYFDIKSGPGWKNNAHHFPQGEQEQIPRSTHVIHLKKYMDFKKRLLDRPEYKCHPMEKCTPNIGSQSKIHEHREGANTAAYDEEQSSCPKHVPTPDVDNVLHQYVCTDRGADGQSKRNSYEMLNTDTMEPRHKVCQCKAHPKRARSRKCSTTWEGQTKNYFDTCPQTSSMHPYIEALCQRTAEIMLHKLRSKPETSEMVPISNSNRHIGSEDDLDTIVDGFVQPDENHSLSNVATGGFDEGDLHSNQEMKPPIDRDSFPHESTF